MSVIAWDGRILAADRQITNNCLRCEGSKIRALPGNKYVLGWTGENEQGLTLATWFYDGAKIDAWPKFQDDRENWTRLIVATGNSCYFYEMLPVKQVVLDKFAAWGSGRDFALGAMGMGANAIEAVEVAIRFSTECGFGVESHKLW